MSRRVCVVTGSRSEYGLLKWVMKGLEHGPEFELQIIVTGMHLAPEFGLTYRDIVADQFVIDRKVDVLLASDSPSAIAKSMGLGMIGVGEAIEQLAPDLMIILGDRFEIFAAVAAALIAGVPVAHLHGGESTEGAFDEAIRHAITKMSHLHFVATEEYRRRVVQLGENPNRVFLVGGLGIDNIKKTELLSRSALEASIDFQFGKRNLIITFHPPTLEHSAATLQMQELLAALQTLDETHLIFTMPNADTGGRDLARMIDDFVGRRPNARAYRSLGTLRYLSCLQHVDAVVGNSSSGIIEMPSFRKGTINIGDRQLGRVKAASIIDCDATRDSILDALKQLYSAEFQSALAAVENPYGDGGAADKVVSILKDFPLDNLIKKSFYDLPPGLG